MNCPKCGTPNMYDNRGNKRNPRSPDMKCRNKECGHGVWDTPKPGNGPGAPAAAPARNGGTGTTWDVLARTYQRCYAIAGKIVGNDNPDRHAATATLFIEARKSGMAVEAPKPPPPPPPVVDTYSEDGEYIDDGAY